MLNKNDGLKKLYGKEKRRASIMKKIVNRILWSIVILLIAVVGMYYSYGKKENFVRADMKFLGVTKEKVIASGQEEIEHIYMNDFTDYYFRKVVDEEYYLKTAKIEEVMDIFLAIEDTEFQYEKAKLSGASLGGVTLEIPTVTMEQSYLYRLSGYRTAVGRYIFDQVEVEQYEDGKTFPNKIIDNRNMINCSALFTKEKIKDHAYTAFSGITIKNGRKMIPGTYYEDGDQAKDYIVLKKDGTFTTKEMGEDFINYYKVIDYKDSQVHQEYLMDYFLIDTDFYSSPNKFEVIDNHTLKRGEKLYRLRK